MRSRLLVLLSAAAFAQADAPPTPPMGAAPPPEAAAPPDTTATEPAPPAEPAPETPAEPPPQPDAQGQYLYWGFHPVPDGQGTFCTEPGLHAHPFPPFDEHLFARYGDAWVFIGDPYDFGYGGGATWFYDHHPLPWGGWCYIGGPHRHLFAPWGSWFAWEGPYVVFVGVYDDFYWWGYPRWVYYWQNVYVPRYRPVAPSPGPHGATAHGSSTVPPVRVWSPPPTQTLRGARPPAPPSSPGSPRAYTPRGPSPIYGPPRGVAPPRPSAPRPTWTPPRPAWTPRPSAPRPMFVAPRGGFGRRR